MASQFELLAKLTLWACARTSPRDSSRTVLCSFGYRAWATSKDRFHALLFGEVE